MDIPLVFSRRLQLGKYRETLAVRRQVIVRNSTEVPNLLIGPQARLAGDERSILQFIIRHHNTVLRILEEQLLSMVRPDRQTASGRGDLPLAARASWWNRKGPNIHLILTRLIRFVRDPLTIR